MDVVKIMKNKYCVTIVRTGCVYIEAKSEADALDIANHLYTDTVSWSDDWEADVADIVDEDCDDSIQYISEKDFG